MSLLYNPFEKTYSLFCFDDKFSKYDQLHNKTIRMKLHPYSRLLAWRIRYCVNVNIDKIDSEEVQNLIISANLSENSHNE